MKNLSVVIANYNQLDHLKITSNRIRELNKEVELILTDDCSDDGSIEWAKQSNLFDNIYSESIRKPYQLSTIKNNGIKLSSKDYILLLDVSCYPNKFCLESHYHIVTKDAKSISQGIIEWMESDSIPIIKENIYLENNYKKISPAWKKALGGNLSFSKSLWKEIKYFDENFNGAWGCEDNDFIIRLEKIGCSVFIHDNSQVFHMKHERKCQEAYDNRFINFDKFDKKHNKIRQIQEQILLESLKINRNNFADSFKEAAQRIYYKKILS